MVNEPSMFELLKIHCSFRVITNVSVNWMRPVQLFKLLVSVLPQILARVCACHKLQEFRANIRYHFALLNTALVPGQNICYHVALLNATQVCVQKSKVIENVLPWIPVHNGKRQQEKGSRAKHSLEACIFEHSHGVAVASCWTLSMLGKNISSRQIDDIFFLLFRGNRLWHFMQTVSWGGSLHEIPKPVCSEK